MVKKNYFTTNQADLMIKGGDEPNIVSPVFCNKGPLIDTRAETIEIVVHVSAMVAEANGLSN